MRTATICDRILENHPYGCILHIKYFGSEKQFENFAFFVYSWFQYSFELQGKV